MAVRLLSIVHQELWEEHARDYKKVHCEQIIGQVWRAGHTDPDRLQTIVVSYQGDDVHARVCVAGGVRVGMSQAPQ